MKPSETLLEELKNIDRIEGCHEISSAKRFFIIEETASGTSVITREVDENAVFFSVINPNEEEINFIPIDGKNGILRYDGSYCDAVIFENRFFTFLEFKLNATSRAERAIRKNREKAVEQLLNTIQFFDEKLGRNYQDLELEAIIATPDIYPRKDTAWDSLAIEFLEEYGIPLYEDRKKEYGENI